MKPPIPQERRNAEDYHPDLLAIRRYWEEKRGTRTMPSRADIDPIELKRFLPGIMLLDVVEDARRYVYRLVGTREVAMRGRDPTGQSIVQGFFGPSLENSLAFADAVVQGRVPVFRSGAFVAPDGRVGDEEVVILPLADDGETVNKILVYTHHRLV